MSTGREASSTLRNHEPSSMSEESKDALESGQEDQNSDTTVAEAQNDPAIGRSKASITIIILALCMATFLAALDVAVVTTALPYIAEDLKASQTAYSWVGSAYLLTYAAFTPFWAKCSDIFGRKPLLLLANVVFLIGSLICALANSIAMLIAGRAVQGAGGGGLIILVNITISDLFSIRERGKYLGFIGMVWATASAIGPVIGGVLAEKVSWRWCFYINLPSDGAAFLVLLFFLKVHNPRTNILQGLRAIDWLGSFVVVGATLMLLLGLQFGGIKFAWKSATVICLILFGVFVFAIFILIEWKVAKYPVIPLRIFKKRSALATLGVASTHGFAFVAAAYFLPYYFQEALGETPIYSAVYFLPLALVLALFSIVTGFFVKWTGHYLEPIIGGMAFATLGFGLFINFSSHRSWPRIVIFQIIAAIGLGPNFQGPLIALQTSVSPSDIATGTATFGFTRNLSSAISIVVGGVILQNEMLKHVNDFRKAGIPQHIINLVSGGSSTAGSAISSQLSETQNNLLHSAIADSLSKIWIFYTCMLGVGLLCSLGIGRTELSKKHKEHKTGLVTEEANRLQNDNKEVDQEKADT